MNFNTDINSCANHDPIWYPFTQMAEFESENESRNKSENEQKSPLVITRGQGCLLYDNEGKSYIDGISSLWTNVHGHNHPKLNQAIISQLQKISHSTLLGQTNEIAIAFAKKLMAVAPKGLSRLFYSDNGSTSVEVAIKMAFQFHQQAKTKALGKKRDQFISLNRAYHGDTIGSVSVGGIDLFHQLYEKLLFKSMKVESPHCYRCPFGQEGESSCHLECFSHLEEVFKLHGETAVAIVVEPLVQGASGIIVHPKGYLRKIRELCDLYGVFLIADEVAVGFGKTGTMFACEQEDVVPDFLCLSKGISAGYLPLAATLVREEIFQGFLGEYHETKTFFHGHTYTGNSLACAVAKANLELFESESTLVLLQDKIAFLSQSLNHFYDLQAVGDIRQKGIMVGIELVSNRITKESFPVSMRIGHQVIMEARKEGVILRPLGDVIVIMPPLAITQEELQQILEVTYRAIQKVTEINDQQ